MTEIVPDALQREGALFAVLVLCALFAAISVAILLWISPRFIARPNLQALSPGKDRLDAEASIRETLLKSLGIFGSIIAATALAFSYVDKVNAQNEAAAAQSYFEAIKNLQAVNKEEQRAMAVASVAAIARSSRNLTPMAMDFFATYVRTLYRYESSSHQLDKALISQIPGQCQHMRAKFPLADVEVIINSMSNRRQNYDRSDRSWNLSGLDLHTIFFARGFSSGTSSINLTGSNLSAASFESGIDLEDAQFGYADLACAAFGAGTNLSRAQFRDSDLRGAVLAGVNFSNADLAGADIRGADFSGANFRDAMVLNLKACREDIKGSTIKVITDATLENFY